MMQKLWQEKLKLTYSKNVIDIIQYGSSVIEGSEPKDLDISVFYNKIPLKDQLNESQEIKNQLQKHADLPIHIKSFDLYSFFDKANFAKEVILFYGRSLISKDYFSKNFGLTPKLHIFYSLDKLKKKDKIRFHYMLKGKGGKYGVLREYGGKLIRPGMIEILSEHEKIFIDLIKKHISSFELRKVFVL